MGRKLGKALFWIMILLLLLLPLGLIFRISQQERQAYEPQQIPQIRQVSLGLPMPVTRKDVPLYVMVSGTFRSTQTAFMELPYYNAYDIRWLVEPGEEIQEGQVLGYYREEPVKATLSGILKNVNLSQGNAYLTVDLFEPLELECTVEEDTLKELNQYRDSLTTMEGAPVTITYIAQAQNPDGTTTVRFSLDREGDRYGAAVTGMPIMLGISYPQVLVLPASCVYQKEKGEDNPWFAQEVTQDGILMGERTVTVSYLDKDIAIVSGVEEGQYFDNGYGVVEANE